MPSAFSSKTVVGERGSKYIVIRLPALKSVVDASFGGCRAKSLSTFVYVVSASWLCAVAALFASYANAVVGALSIKFRNSCWSSRFGVVIRNRIGGATPHSSCSSLLH